MSLVSVTSPRATDPKHVSSQLRAFPQYEEYRRVFGALRKQRPWKRSLLLHFFRRFVTWRPRSATSTLACGTWNDVNAHDLADGAPRVRRLRTASPPQHRHGQLRSRIPRQFFRYPTSSTLAAFTIASDASTIAPPAFPPFPASAMQCSLSTLVSYLVSLPVIVIVIVIDLLLCLRAYHNSAATPLGLLPVGVAGTQGSATEANRNPGLRRNPFGVKTSTTIVYSCFGLLGPPAQPFQRLHRRLASHDHVCLLAPKYRTKVSEGSNVHQG